MSIEIETEEDVQALRSIVRDELSAQGLLPVTKTKTPIYWDEVAMTIGGILLGLVVLGFSTAALVVVWKFALA